MKPPAMLPITDGYYAYFRPDGRKMGSGKCSLEPKTHAEHQATAAIYGSLVAFSDKPFTSPALPELGQTICGHSWEWIDAKQQKQKTPDL